MPDKRGSQDREALKLHEVSGERRQTTDRLRMKPFSRLPCEYGSAGLAHTCVSATPPRATILLRAARHSPHVDGQVAAALFPLIMGHSEAYFQSRLCAFLRLNGSLGPHGMRKICNNGHSTCAKTEVVTFLSADLFGHNPSLLRNVYCTSWRCDANETRSHTRTNAYANVGSAE